jgi:hypothetical protein
MTLQRGTLAAVEPPDTRELLGRELGKLSGAHVERWLETADRLGLSELGLVIEPEASRRGTERGARLGARFTKVDHVELELELDSAPDAVLRKAFEILQESGELRDLGGDRAAPTVAAVVRSGFGGMNPALVRVAVAPAGAGTRVKIEADALEGLIKQRAAAKASRRVADLLAER